MYSSYARAGHTRGSMVRGSNNCCASDDFCNVFVHFTFTVRPLGVTVMSAGVRWRVASNLRVVGGRPSSAGETLHTSVEWPGVLPGRKRFRQYLPGCPSAGSAIWGA